MTQSEFQALHLMITSSEWISSTIENDPILENWEIEPDATMDDIKTHVIGVTKGKLLDGANLIDVYIEAQTNLNEFFENLEENAFTDDERIDAIIPFWDTARAILVDTLDHTEEEG